MYGVQQFFYCFMNSRNIVFYGMISFVLIYLSLGEMEKSETALAIINIKNELFFPPFNRALTEIRIKTANNVTPNQKYQVSQICRGGRFCTTRQHCQLQQQ